MADELIDICDENNNLLNVQKMKSEAHKKGLWHRASHIWIYNSKGEVLLQLRSKEKDLFPNMWDLSVGGHICAGNNHINTAINELEEELGLKIKKEDLKFYKIKKVEDVFKKLKNREFLYIYLLKCDGNISDLKLQKEELQKIDFLPIEKIEKELINNSEKFFPHGDYWFEPLNEIKKKYFLSHKFFNNQPKHSNI